MDELFIALIHAYLAAIEEATLRFERQLGVPRPKSPVEWIESLPQVGYLDPERSIRYFLHGFGCWVDLPTGRVDWDFGPDGQTDIIDTFFLLDFARRRPGSFPEYQSEEIFYKALDCAVSHGLLRRAHPQYNNQWYLSVGEKT